MRVNSAFVMLIEQYLSITEGTISRGGTFVFPVVNGVFSAKSCYEVVWVSHEEPTIPLDNACAGNSLCSPASSVAPPSPSYSPCPGSGSFAGDLAVGTKVAGLSAFTSTGRIAGSTHEHSREWDSGRRRGRPSARSISRRSSARHRIGYDGARRAALKGDEGGRAFWSWRGRCRGFYCLMPLP